MQNEVQDSALESQREIANHEVCALVSAYKSTLTVSSAGTSKVQADTYSGLQAEYATEASDSDEDDDVSEVESIINNRSDFEEAPFASSKIVHSIKESESPDLHNVDDPETQARLEALLEAAGLGKSSSDGKHYADPEVLRRLTSSVSCALDEAAAALTRMRSETSTQQGEGRSLAEACSDGDVGTVRKLLDEGRSVHETTEEGESLLSLACSAGYYELAQVLLAMRANVEDRGIKGDCTPLMEAASAGHVDIVRLLIAHGADVNAQSSSGNTPLMYACAGGHEEVVKVLLVDGANVEDHNENGHTPLMEAASAGHVGVAKILLEHGAGINTHSNEFKESALTLACYKGHLEMVRFLLEAGADQEHKTDEMHTALMEASMDGHVEVAKLLLDSGAQVNMPADSFESPLTLAACGGHVELAMLLLERGANIEEVNDEGYTPLMEAAREGHEEMVALLLSQGADINAQTEETQETALTLACCGGFLEVADFLIKAGADIELGASTPLMEAAQEGHLELVRYLLEANVTVSAQTGTGDTALTYACENGHTDVADLLLQYGADLEHESEGGRTPLMKAARAGHLCTVQFLISRGANVNQETTNNDHTPLSLACAGGHLAVVELLLAHGSEHSHKLKDNSTMLIEAAKGGHTNVVQLLIDYPTSLMVSPGTDFSQLAVQPSASVVEGEVEQPRVPPHGLAMMPPADGQVGQSAGTTYVPNIQSASQVPDGTSAMIVNMQQTRQNSQKSLLRKNRGVASSGEYSLTTAEIQQTKNAPVTTGISTSPPTLLSGSEAMYLNESGVGLEALEEKEIDAKADISSLVMKGENREEQILHKQQILEELQRVERELLQDKKQAPMLLNSHQCLDQCHSLGVAATTGLGTSGSRAPGVSTSTVMVTTQPLSNGVLVSAQPGLISASSIVTTALPQGVGVPLAMPDLVTEAGGQLQVPLSSLTSVASQTGISLAMPTETTLVSSTSFTTQPGTVVQTVPVQPCADMQQSRESVIVANPNQPCMMSTTPQVSASGTSAECPKVKTVSKKEGKGSKKQQLQVALQQHSQQLQQLHQLKQLNQQLQEQVLQQRKLKQQNQATLAALQQNAVANQQQLVALQQNVTQLQQLEQNVLQQQSTTQSQQLHQRVQQILHQKQQLQLQIKQFQQQVEQQLAFTQQNQDPATSAANTQTSSSLLLQSDPELLPLDEVILGQPDGDSCCGVDLEEDGDEPVETPFSLPQPCQWDKNSILKVDQQNDEKKDGVGKLKKDKKKENREKYKEEAKSQELQALVCMGEEDISKTWELVNGNVQGIAALMSGGREDGNGQVADKEQGTALGTPPLSLPTLQQVTAVSSFEPVVPVAATSSAIGIQVQGTTALQPTQIHLPNASVTGIQYQTVPSSGLQFTGFQAQGIQVQTSAGIQLQYQQLQATTAGVQVPTPAGGVQVLNTGLQPAGNVSIQSQPVAFQQQLLLQAPQIALSGQQLPLIDPSQLNGQALTQFTQPLVQPLVQTPQQQVQVATQTADKKVKGAKKLWNQQQQVQHQLLHHHSQQLQNSTYATQAVVQGIPVDATGGVNHFQSQVGQYAQGHYPQTPLPMVDLDSETESNHDTALTLACAGGHEELVQLLLSRGSEIEHRDKKGFTPLILAATAGHEKVVEILLNHGADIEAQSERTKDTPLSLACSGGRYEVVEILLARGANKEHRNVSDYTPLSLSASGGYVNIIKLLLAHGAEINSRTGSKLGISPLMLAAMNGHTAAVKLLLDMGSDINAQIETNRNTALTLACFQGRHEVVSLLLDRKAHVEHRAKTGLTPLMEAASGGYVEVGRVLLDKGADVNASPVPTSRDTALTIAADKGHYRFVELLLSRGAQVEVRNKKGNSPLWLATNGGHLDVVQLLYSASADIDSQDNRKVSCLMAAFRKGHLKVVKWMVKHVTQFPSDQELTRFITTLSDKELLKKCHQCLEVIRVAKDQQAAEANKNATILLEELDQERTREESKKAAAARKKEKKKKRKQEKKEEKKKLQEENRKNDDRNIEVGLIDSVEQEESPCRVEIPTSAGSSLDVKLLPHEKPREEVKSAELEREGDSGIDANSQGSNSSTDVKIPERKKEKKKKVKENSRNDKNKKFQHLKGNFEVQISKVDETKDDCVTSHSVSHTKVIESDWSSTVASVQHQKPTPAAVLDRSVKGSESEALGDGPSGQDCSLKKDLIFESACHTGMDNLDDFDMLTNKTTKAGKVGKGQNMPNISALDSFSVMADTATSTVKENMSTKYTTILNHKLSYEPISATGTNTSPKRISKREDGWKEVIRRSKKVSVPTTAISRVIGRAGCNINAIREISGAHIEVEKACKGVGNRTVVIKGSADATRQAHQLINALIKDPDKELQEFLPKTTKSSATPSIRTTSCTTTTAVVTTKSLRTASTVHISAANTKAPVITSSTTVPSPLASVPTINHSAIVASLKTTLPRLYGGDKQIPVQIITNNTKTTASYTTAAVATGKKAWAVTTTTNSTKTFVASMCKTTSSVGTIDRNSSPPSNLPPRLAAAGNSALEGGAPHLAIPPHSELASMPPMSVGMMPAAVSTQCQKSQNYSPFDNTFSKVAQESVWRKDKDTEGPKGMNFASVAASGVTSVASAAPSISRFLSSVPPQEMPQIDLSKAPGYRGGCMGSPGSGSSVGSASSGYSSAPVSSVPGSTACTTPGHSTMVDMRHNPGTCAVIAVRSAPGTPVNSAGPIAPPSGQKRQHSTPPPLLSSSVSTPFHPLPVADQDGINHSRLVGNGPAGSNGTHPISASLSYNPGTLVTSSSSILSANLAPGASVVTPVSFPDVNTLSSRVYPPLQHSLPILPSGFSVPSSASTNSRFTSPQNASITTPIFCQNLGTPISTAPPIQSKLNPNAPDFSSRAPNFNQQNAYNFRARFPFQNQMSAFQSILHTSGINALASLNGGPGLGNIPNPNNVNPGLLQGMAPSSQPLFNQEFPGGLPPVGMTFPGPEAMQIMKMGGALVMNPMGGTTGFIPSQQSMDSGGASQGSGSPTGSPPRSNPCSPTGSSNIPHDYNVQSGMEDHRLPQPIGTGRAHRKMPVHNSSTQDAGGIWSYDSPELSTTNEWLGGTMSSSAPTPTLNRDMNLILMPNSGSNLQCNLDNMSSNDRQQLDAFQQVPLGPPQSSTVNGMFPPTFFNGMPAQSLHGLCSGSGSPGVEGLGQKAGLGDASVRSDMWKGNRITLGDTTNSKHMLWKKLNEY